jgi:transposase-like protein
MGKQNKERRVHTKEFKAEAVALAGKLPGAKGA